MASNWGSGTWGSGAFGGEIQRVVNLTALVAEGVDFTSNVDVLIADELSLTSSLSVTINATEQLTASMDIFLDSTQKVSSNTDVLVKATLTTNTSLDANILTNSGESLLRIRGDIKTRFWAGHPSDANFPEEFSNVPVGGVTETLTGNGDIDQAFQQLDFTFTNDEPTGVSFDAYSIGIDTASFGTDIPVGSRILVGVTLSQFDENTDIAIGLVDSHTHDTWQQSDRLGILLQNEEGHLNVFLLWGDHEEPAFFSALSPEFLLNKVLIIELERTSSSDARARLFVQEDSLDTPLIEVTGTSGDTTIAGSLFHVAPKIEPQPYTPALGQVVGFLDYVDIEVGTGSVFPEPTLGIDVADGKFRKNRDTTLITLTDGDGLKTVCATTAEEDLTTSDEFCNVIELDTAPPVMTLYRVTPESPVISNGAIKTSYQPGFDDIEIVFLADKVGTYTIRANSRNAFTGTEIESGDYDVANTFQSVTFNVASLPGVGLHDVDVYVIAESGIANAKLAAAVPLDASGLVPVSMDMMISPSVSLNLESLVASTETPTSSLDANVFGDGKIVPRIDVPMSVMVSLSVTANLEIWISEHISTEMDVNVGAPDSVVMLLDINITS